MFPILGSVIFLLPHAIILIEVNGEARLVWNCFCPVFLVCGKSQGRWLHFI